MPVSYLPDFLESYNKDDTSKNEQYSSRFLPRCPRGIRIRSTWYVVSKITALRRGKKTCTTHLFIMRRDNLRSFTHRSNILSQVIRGFNNKLFPRQPVRTVAGLILHNNSVGAFSCNITV
ncbi:unnamed protein product, partial [Pylaiella littoralis]